MHNYEITFLIKQECSIYGVYSILKHYEKIIDNLFGKIIKSEYWGISDISHKANLSKRMHRTYIVIKLNKESINIISCVFIKSA